VISQGGGGVLDVPAIFNVTREEEVEAMVA
jgi:hypothetical protein